MYIVYLRIFSQFPTLHILLFFFFYLREASTYLSSTHTRLGMVKEGMSGRRKKKNHGRDDGLPDKGRGTDCYEILSNVRVSAQGVSCSRSASRQNEMLADKSVRRPCERLPVHTYSKPRSPSPPTRPFSPNFPLRAEVLQDI